MNDKCQKTGIRWPNRKEGDITIPENAPFMLLNPIHGCLRVSRGCDNCFARPWAIKVGDFSIDMDCLEKVYSASEMKRVYVCTHSDLFQEWIHDDYRDEIMDAVIQTPHRFYFLTKRVRIMSKYFKGFCKRKNLSSLPDNVAIGATVEHYQYFNRIEILKNIYAREHYISVAPILSTMKNINLSGIDWVIAAGEFDIDDYKIQNGRRCNIEWFRSLRDQCKKYGCDFIIKTLGKHLGGGQILDGIMYAETGDELN